MYTARRQRKKETCYLQASNYTNETDFYQNNGI